MCKHSNLLIGETLDINWKGGICINCNFIVPYNSGKATYDGHREEDGEVVDVFIFTEYRTCAHCGAGFKFITELCQDKPFYWIEHVEEAQEKEDVL